MTAKSWWRAIIGIVGFIIWTVFAFKYPATYLAPYMTFVTGAVIAVVTVVLNDTKPPKE